MSKRLIRPLAYGSTIISDGQGSNSFISSLRGSRGLPAVRSGLSGRSGAWPLLSGIQRPGSVLELQTMLPDDDDGTDRAALLTALNYENEDTQRLTIADYILPGAAPNHVKAWFGPWDLWNGAGTWKMRDVLRGDDLTMALSGSWYTEPGEGLQCAEAFVNYIPNPIFCGTYTTGLCAGYAAYATGTGDGTRSESSIAKYGNQAQRVTKTDGGADNYGVTETAGATSVNVANLSVWVYVVSYTSGAKIGLTGDGSDTGAAALSAELTLTNAHIGVWTRVSDNATGLVEEETWTINAFVSTDDADVIFDGLQLTGTQYKLPTAHGDMPGCSWASTAHASTSTWAASNNTAANVALPLRTGTLRCWVKTTADMDDNGNARVILRLGGNNGIIVYIGAADAYIVSIAGTVYGLKTLTDSDILSDTWHCLHAVWDSTVGVIGYMDGVKIGSTQNYILPTDDASGMRVGNQAGTNVWPGFIDSVLMLDTAMSAAQVAQDYANGRDINPRYLNVRCRAAAPLMDGSRELDAGIIAQLDIDGDVRKRSARGDYDIHTMRAGTYSFVANNPGNDDALPILSITPRTAKTSGYAYKRWIPVKWRAENNFTRYPVDIVNDAFDTATLVTASKMQADGDDLRVMVDGIETERWLQNMNHATTQVWVNLDFQTDRPMTLATAIADSGDVTTIDVNESITFLPTSGILYIGTEAFTYTGKVDASQQFTGVTRAAKSTSAAAHLADADVFWIQHDVWILYGNAGATDPTTSRYDDYKPIIELTSTNTSWVYQEFGEGTGLQSGQWSRPNFSEVYYGGTQGADADPWVELGISSTYPFTYLREYLFNPCFITNANFTNGQKWTFATADFYDAQIQSSVNGYTWVTEDTIADPSADDTWEAWSDSEAITAGSKYVALALSADDGKLEAADCVITLNSDYTPVVAIGSEVGNYPLALTIENATNEKSIVLSLDMDLTQTLIVDTAAKTVTYKTENQQQALTETGAVRRDWLPLSPGDNTINLSDTDTVQLDFELTLERRYYE